MAYDASWPKWVQASVSDHFKTTSDSNGYASLVDGLEERTTAFQESPDRLEIRVNGPFVTEISKDYYLFNVSVNIILFSHMGTSNQSPYVLANMAGVIAKRASEPIPVFKYGAELADDQSQIGCLIPIYDKREGIKIHQFGEITDVNRLRQAAVDCSYKMEICH